jgi:hypothetical protein
MNTPNMNTMTLEERKVLALESMARSQAILAACARLRELRRTGLPDGLPGVPSILDLFEEAP